MHAQAKNRFPWPLIVTFLCGVAMVIHSHRDSNDYFRKNLRMIPPPPNIERFVFGYPDTVADLLWLRVIQDISTCETAKDGVANQKDTVKTAPECRMGWVFKMIDSITNLSPRWKLPHSMGALMLSVNVDDIEGATIIFEKALKRFPYDYNLSYRAAYHFLWEVKQPQRAAELLMTVAKHGGPTWMYALAGKMYSETGQLELAKGVLEGALKETQEDDKGRVRIEARLHEINQKLQFKQWKKEAKERDPKGYPALEKEWGGKKSD